MKYWITTDTHFGHDGIKKFCGRPDNFEQLILKNLVRLVRKEDVLIHLGDVAWTDVAAWHEKLINTVPCRTWLVKGNHDKSSSTWYLERGWDAVVNSLSINRFGKKVLLSHKPMDLGENDINIHGHVHNISEERWAKIEPDLYAKQTDNHIRIMVEHEYVPYSLKSLVEKHNEKIRTNTI